jgi:YD repeat-containing protein
LPGPRPARPAALVHDPAARASPPIYTYDKAGRLATVADPLTGSALTYGYNADSLPATISYATGSTAGAARSYTYNGLQQLTGDTVTSAAGATIASAGYGYNANGDMTSQATTGYAGAGSTNYSYNQADQLTSATAGGTTTSFGYDADGNLTQAGATSSSYNAQDQVTSSASASGSTSYTYTLNGALSSVTPPSGTTQNYTPTPTGRWPPHPAGSATATTRSAAWPPAQPARPRRAWPTPGPRPPWPPTARPATATAQAAAWSASSEAAARPNRP